MIDFISRFIDTGNRIFLVYSALLIIIPFASNQWLSYRNELDLLTGSAETAQMEYNYRTEAFGAMISHVESLEKVVDREISDIRKNRDYYASIGDSVCSRNEHNRANGVVRDWEKSIAELKVGMAEVKASDLKLTKSQMALKSHESSPFKYIWPVVTIASIIGLIVLLFRTKRQINQAQTVKAG